MLSIRVGSNDIQTPRMDAVVDSGAPCCLFRADIGDFLGIDVDSGVGGVVAGMSAVQETVYFHKVNIAIESTWVINVMAGFIRKLTVPGILGRIGFFDHFHVGFDHSSQAPVLEVEPIELFFDEQKQKVVTKAPKKA